MCVPGGLVQLAVISVVSATRREEVDFQVLVQALALRRWSVINLQGLTCTHWQK